MIAIMNPEDGDYQLQITPSSSTTTFIVSQFLQNNQTFYDEYKFKGLVQDPKIIEFNSKHAIKGILHEFNDYRQPHFPKFWFEFWKFWNKFHR